MSSHTVLQRAVAQLQLHIITRLKVPNTYFMPTCHKWFPLRTPGLPSPCTYAVICQTAQGSISQQLKRHLSEAASHSLDVRCHLHSPVWSAAVLWHPTAGAKKVKPSEEQNRSKIIWEEEGRRVLIIPFWSRAGTAAALATAENRKVTDDVYLSYCSISFKC